MQVYFSDADKIAPPPRKNTQPLVKEWSSGHFIQVASEYPYKTEGYLDNIIHKRKIPT